MPTHNTLKPYCPRAPPRSKPLRAAIASSPSTGSAHDDAALGLTRRSHHPCLEAPFHTNGKPTERRIAVAVQSRRASPDGIAVQSKHLVANPRAHARETQNGGRAPQESV